MAESIDGEAPSSKYPRLDEGEKSDIELFVNDLQNSNIRGGMEPYVSWDVGLLKIRDDHINLIKPGAGLVGSAAEESEFREELERRAREQQDEGHDGADNAAGHDDGNEGSEEQSDDTEVAETDSIDEFDMDINPLEVSDDSPAAGPQPPANSQAHSCPAALTGEVIQKYSKKTHWKGGQEAEVDFEELGDHEGNEMGTWINFHGRSMPLAHLVNSKWWLHMIKDLYNTPLMETPPHMTVQPHPWQLKGAAQGIKCCQGPFKGFLLGDDMGVGKTLTAILMMYHVKDEPGMYLVICPASLCTKWVNTIEKSWEKGHGLTALHLTKSTMSASELLATGYDVIVCSVEFVEINQRARKVFPEQVINYANRPSDSTMRPPDSPDAILSSDFWEISGVPWKMVIIDEAQKVNKRTSMRHQAIKELHARAKVCISGTLPHNKWYDMDGYVDFLDNHPFDSTHEDFVHTFTRTGHSRTNKVPPKDKLLELQRFLQPFTISRPADLLKLPDLKVFKAKFELYDNERMATVGFHHEYREALLKLAGMQNSDAPPSTVKSQGLSQGLDDKMALKFAMLAQLASIHHLLLFNRKEIEAINADTDNNVQSDDEDGKETEGLSRARLGQYVEFAENFEQQTEEYEGNFLKEREAWKKLLKNTSHENLIFKSARTVFILRLYHICLSKFPGEKMVIFSQYLKYLDVLGEAFARMGVKCYRYDGSVKANQRPSVEEAFKRGNPRDPLLITSGAGGVGLDMQHASICIQVEPWWNRNVELQAVGRIHRQGQNLVVKWYRVYGTNSPIDEDVVKTQCTKVEINKELMEPLVRNWDEGPDIRDLLTYEYPRANKYKPAVNPEV